MPNPAEAFYAVPQELDQLLVRQIFDCIDGVLIYKLKTGRRTHIGDKVVGLDAYGYVVVRLGYKRYKAHRLVWLWHKGSWPSMHLDHINKNRSDNRLENLREANFSQNRLNSKLSTNNTSGYRGVGHSPEGRWVASAKFEGNTVYLGTHNTPEEASAAYQNFAKASHGEFYQAVV